MCCDVPKLDKIMLDEVLPTMLEREIISEAERDDLVKKIEEGPSEDEQ
jgi:hypothetical protein